MGGAAGCLGKSAMCLLAFTGGLVAGAPAAAQSLPANAEFRYHLLAELEGETPTGCSMQRGPQRWEGLHLRWEVRADRGQVRNVSRYRCVAGAWAMQDSIDGGEQVLPQIPGGGDRFGWQIERSALASGSHAIVHVFAEDPVTGALDIAGGTEGWALAAATLGATAATAIPSMGGPGLVLLLGLILLVARGAVRGDRSSPKATPSLLHGIGALCCFGMALLASGGIRADEMDAATTTGQPASLVLMDPSHDLQGNEPAVDLLQVELTAGADSIRVEVTVHDIQPATLPDRAKLLFIGSNLTSTNNLPGLFSAMAAQRGKTVQVASITFNGASLEDHFIKGEVLREIGTGRYDVVIMQQGPSTLPENQVHLREWSARMNGAIRASGARPALLMVWPDASRAAFFHAASASYRSAAIAIDGRLLPAGEAWLAAWREDPLLDLYANDQNNPSPLGSYAAAATLFAGLYRQSPEGLPSRVQVDGETLRLRDTEARILQRAAWQAHLRHGLAGR